MMVLSNLVHVSCAVNWRLFGHVYVYHNTMIAGSPHDERIFFWNNKVRLSKNEFLNFCFFSKNISKNDLK